MAETNIQWTARHRVIPIGECVHSATGEVRCLDVTCERCWVKGYTVNPWIGCEKVSAACKHCYAEAVAENRMGLDAWGKDAIRKLQVDSAIRDLRRIDDRACRTGQRVGCFSGSMCDIFEDREGLIGARARYLSAALRAEDVDVMLLTKRPENALRMVPSEWLDDWPSHVWLGATIEDGATCFERMPHVVEWAGHGITTFLSVEPMLGNILAAAPPLDMVDLVIIGGESGGGARSFDLDLAERLVWACDDADANVFFKQMGSRWAQANPGGLRKGASHGQDPYRWPAWAQRREIPKR